MESLQNTLDRIRQIESRFATASAQPAQPVGGGEFEAILSGLTNPEPEVPSASSLPDQGALDRLIEAQASKNGMDPALIRAVVQTESGFNPRAVSAAGARGLMQLMPGTADMLGVQDSFNATQNLDGGSRYLKGLMNQYQSLPKALAAYNAGPGAVDKYKGIPPYQETQHYVKKVMDLYQQNENRSNGV